MRTAERHDSEVRRPVYLSRSLAKAVDEDRRSRSFAEYTRTSLEHELMRGVDEAIERRAVQKLAHALSDPDIRWLIQQMRNKHLPRH